MYYHSFTYKNESKQLADRLYQNSDMFIAMYNEDGVVRHTNAIIEGDDYNFLYGCVIPFIKDVIANYFIFNDFSKTTLLIMDGDILTELEFNTLEELRIFYIQEV